MSNYSLMHWCSVKRKSTKVLNLFGPITPMKEVEKNPWVVQKFLGRIQISTMCVKNNLMVAGGFEGQMIAKNLDSNGVSYCAKITHDENAITNAIEIYDSIVQCMGKEHALVISNHHSDIDWLVGWILAQRSSCLGGTLAIMKKSSKFLPVMGWSMWLLEYVFLERSWVRDEARLESGL